jgi:hypothetical protein
VTSSWSPATCARTLEIRSRLVDVELSGETRLQSEPGNLHRVGLQASVLFRQPNPLLQLAHPDVLCCTVGHRRGQHIFQIERCSAGGGGRRIDAGTTLTKHIELPRRVGAERVRVVEMIRIRAVRLGVSPLLVSAPPIPGLRVAGSFLPTVWPSRST